MIKLLAASPEDGWALAQDESCHWLLRPPYRLKDRTKLSPKQLRRALEGEDFLPMDQEFLGWGSLTRHLVSMRMAKVSSSDMLNARSAAARILARADARQASEHLSRIQEAIDAGKTRGITDALLALLEAEAVVQSPELIRRVRTLLAAARAKQKNSAKRQAQNSWPVRDEEQIEEVSRSISERGTIWNFPASSAA